MRRHILWWLLRRMPAIVCGALAVSWLGNLIRPQGNSAYELIGGICMGAVIGLWVHRSIHGLVIASRVGAMPKVLWMTILGGLGCGVLGLVARYMAGETVEEHPWLFGAGYLSASLRWTIGGMILILLGKGEDYQQQSGTSVQAM